MPPWTDCNDALALGADGERCQFTDSCQTPLRDCCRTVASCSNGALNVDARCDPCPCFIDIDCGPGAWCTNGSCRACAIPRTPCRLPFILADRNGCFYCVPPTKCDEDADCPTGERCYAGQTCTPDCAEGDPACCHGNGCAPPGCGTTASLDCYLVGCPDGYYCDVVDDQHGCDCFPGGWRCSKPPNNVCRPF